MRELRVLVCNDDGVDAPGLALLSAVARGASDDVWIVAPERKWTAASHQLTFDRDLALTRREPRVYTCSGAPADCVVGAITLLFADRRPDLVLAGINDKRNVGEDIAYSGTCAIAREATFQGVPAIALSRDTRWTDTPAELAALRRLLGAWWSTRDEWAREGHWLSVLLPNALPAPVRTARLARDKLASATDVIERADDRIVFRLRRGRPATAHAGDENAQVNAGAVTVVRHTWRAAGSIHEDLLEQWSAALADDEPVA